MGIEWTRRAEERFQHALQQSTRRRLGATPLFVPEEQETVTYPCHWLDENKTLPVGTRLTIFQCADRARVAVLHGSEAVAEVRGEAARDLKQLFKEQPQLHNALAVSIVRIGEPSEPFYVQPRKLTTKRPKRTIQ
jgi:hypothetical protein